MQIAVFTVTLNVPCTNTVLVDYTTVDLSAVNYVNYVVQRGTLVFQPEQTSQTVTVNLMTSTTALSTSQFQLLLTNAREVSPTLGLVIDPYSAVCTISASPSYPAVPFPGRRLGIMGDSLLYANNYWYPSIITRGNDTGTGAGPVLRSSYFSRGMTGIVNYANSILNNAFELEAGIQPNANPGQNSTAPNVGYNFSIYSSKLSQWFNPTFDPAPIPPNPSVNVGPMINALVYADNFDMIVMMGGTNDLAAGATANQIVFNLMTYALQFAAAGKWVFVQTISPRTSDLFQAAGNATLGYSAGYTQSQVATLLQTILNINDQLRLWLTTTDVYTSPPNIFLVDHWYDLLGPIPSVLSTVVGGVFTASSSGFALTVTNVSGFISVGSLLTGTGISGTVRIVSQQSGTRGSAGLYTTDTVTTCSSNSITAIGIPTDPAGLTSPSGFANFTGSSSGTTLTVTNVSGFIQSGQLITGTGITGTVTIVRQITPYTTGEVHRGAGRYLTSASTSCSASAILATSTTAQFTGTSSGSTTLTVTDVTVGSILPGQTITAFSSTAAAAGIPTAPYIVATASGLTNGATAGVNAGLTLTVSSTTGLIYPGQLISSLVDAPPQFISGGMIPPVIGGFAATGTVWIVEQLTGTAGGTGTYLTSDVTFCSNSAVTGTVIILSQLSGTPGGAGTYQTSVSTTVPAGTILTSTGGLISANNFIPSQTGNFRPDAPKLRFNYDGLHFTPAGAYVAGKVLATAMKAAGVPAPVAGYLGGNNSAAGGTGNVAPLVTSAASIMTNSNMTCTLGPTAAHRVSNTPVVLGRAIGLGNVNIVTGFAAWATTNHITNDTYTNQGAGYQYGNVPNYYFIYRASNNDGESFSNFNQYTFTTLPGTPVGFQDNAGWANGCLTTTINPTVTFTDTWNVTRTLPGLSLTFTQPNVNGTSDTTPTDPYTIGPWNYTYTVPAHAAIGRNEAFVVEYIVDEGQWFGPWNSYGYEASPSISPGISTKYSPGDLLACDYYLKFEGISPNLVSCRGVLQFLAIDPNNGNTAAAILASISLAESYAPVSKIEFCHQHTEDRVMSLRTPIVVVPTPNNTPANLPTWGADQDTSVYLKMVWQFSFDCATPPNKQSAAIPATGTITIINPSIYKVTDPNAQPMNIPNLTTYPIAIASASTVGIPTITLT